MLTLDGDAFTTAWASYHHRSPDEPRDRSQMCVRFALAEQVGEGAFYAILDTGAEWSILNNEVAARAGLLAPTRREETIPLTIRTTKLNWTPSRTCIVLLAEEGPSVELEATVLVHESWCGPNFLGYRGLLEGLRFALDPLSTRFHFGHLPDPLH